jgi:hypothetical protein
MTLMVPGGDSHGIALKATFDIRLIGRMEADGHRANGSGMGCCR